jgi:hypothetical protein
VEGCTIAIIVTGLAKDRRDDREWTGVGRAPVTIRATAHHATATRKSAGIHLVKLRNSAWIDSYASSGSLDLSMHVSPYRSSSARMRAASLVKSHRWQ